MKKAAYLLAFALALPLCADVGLELIPNGDFGTLDANGWGAEWPRGRGAKIVSDKDGKRLVLDGAGAQVDFLIPLKPEWGQLKLATQMKVTGVALGKESWNTGRLTMCFMDDAGQRVGAWPDVFGFIGTTDWQPCERLYAIPKGATRLSIAPSNLGASGMVEFRALSLKVSRVRAMRPANAPLPDGAPQDVWGLGDAWRQATPTRERICLNGLWQFRPVLTNEVPDSPPGADDCWGWCKIPAVWPNQWEGDTAPQRIWLAPWLEENVENAHVFEQAWYKRKITVPESFKDKRVALDFTMLQTHAKVFIDGQHIGEVWYPGGEIGLGMTPGKEHEIALLVTARPFSATHQAFMAPDRVIESKASVKLRGITGDLYLSAKPYCNFADAHIITSTRDGTITFVVEDFGAGLSLTLPRGNFKLRVEVKGCGESKTFVSPKIDLLRDGAMRFTVPWKNPKLWDTHTPQNLYTANISLLFDDKVVDTLPPITFGFREFGIAGRDFILNGTPIHLRALHNTTMNAPADKASKAAALEHCRRVKEYGFNFIIAGNYDFAAGSTAYLDGLLEACDETGLLLAFSLPHIKDFGYDLRDPDRAERYRQQARWLTRRARNHPSVIFYAMNHNSCGYYGDQNPLKIDGIYAPPDSSGAKGAWWENNRRNSLIAADIAAALDPTRPVYHHQSGNLGPLHTVNIYLNWAPRQERSDWLGHWAANGQKPLFFVEWGLPHISSWSSYRGPKFIWSSPAFQSLWASEYAAQFWGDAAYQPTPEAHAALAHEEALWAKGEEFHWHQLNRPLHALTNNYHNIQAHFADDNWRAHRAHGISAMLPWDQEGLWQRVAETRTRPNPDAFKNLKRPGITPDNLHPGNQYINDTGAPSAFAPTALGRSFLRWNQPDCAFIGGDTEDGGRASPRAVSSSSGGVHAAPSFTDKTRHYPPGADLRKTLVILNDRRTPQTIRWTCALTPHTGTPAHRDDRRASIPPKPIKTLSGALPVLPGGKALVPVTFKLPPDIEDGYTLNATFEFENKITQTDTFNLFTVQRGNIIADEFNFPIILYDTKGITAQHFDRLRIPYTKTNGQLTPSGNNGKQVLVIGRESLDETSAQWVKNMKDASHIIVMEQASKPLTELLGFRIAERGSRLLFPRCPHPVTEYIHAERFRDWAGSSTLLPEHLDDLDALELHDPRWQWSGHENTRAWRCGNRNSVASVLIEKPARGDWLALIDGEFDLQYSPLLEYVENRRRVTFCQLDVSGRTAPDPAADELTICLLGEALFNVERFNGAPFMGHRYPIPPFYHEICWGGPSRPCTILGDNATQLCASLGVEPLSRAPLTIASSGAGMPDGLHQQIADGATVLCLGMNADEVAKWSPVPLTATFTNAFFTRIEQLPPELNGLSNADWAWHGQMAFHALPPAPDGNAALRVIRHGNGKIVFWQVPPWMIDEVKKPYLRTTKRRANAMASRLLANLGAAFASPFPALYLDTPEPADDPYRYYRW
ncbi:MAG: hypothetical protein FWG50_03285 [Kiritimatiellaeota bacterium]|nr:hypothetical protein [Kiritimatiellota bacterium]